MLKFHTIYKSNNEISYYHGYSEKSEKANPFYPAESHSRIELFLVLSGKTDYFINGLYHHMKAGDLLVINAGEFHTSQVDNTEYYEYMNLHFPPSLIPKLKDLDANAPFLNAKLYQHIIPKRVINNTKIPFLLQEIAIVAKTDNPHKELQIIAIIQSIVAELNIIVADLLTQEYHFLSPSQNSNTLVQDAIQYINSEVENNINVATVASTLGISEAYLHRLFKNVMGISVHNYLQHQKMQCALSLLRQGHSAQNVSERLGYEYYATFLSQFVKVFGKPPTHFK